MDRARHRALSFSHKPFADLHPSQYLLRQGPGKRGRLGVCEDLRRVAPSLEADTVFLQLDVRNYYGSIGHGWLEQRLGLPANIVRSQVHYGGMCLSIGAGMSTHVHLLDGARQEMARRGIPGGSALSPLVAEMVMADVLRGLPELPSRTWLWTYSDNIGIFCPVSAANRLKDLFRERFAAHGAGPFELWVSDPVSVRREFKFLGTWWQLRDGALVAHVPEEVSVTKMIDLKTRAMHASPGELVNLTGRIQSQIYEWQFWPGVGAWAYDVLCTVRECEEHLRRQGTIVPEMSLLRMDRKIQSALQRVARA